MIDNDKFFQGYGLKKVHLNGIESYKAPETETYYRLDHFCSFYVIEWAGNTEEAGKNIFEDTDLFDDSLPEDELLKQLGTFLEECMKKDKEEGL